MLVFNRLYINKQQPMGSDAQLAALKLSKLLQVRLTELLVCDHGRSLQARLQVSVYTGYDFGHIDSRQATLCDKLS